MSEPISSSTWQGPPLDAYAQVGWETFSPYKRIAIDQLAREMGITLHHATDVETLRRVIRIYQNTSW